MNPNEVLQPANPWHDPGVPGKSERIIDPKVSYPPAGAIRIGAAVFFGPESIPCHILGLPAADGLAQGAINDVTTQAVLAPVDGRRAKNVPTSPVPFAETPTDGCWSFRK